MTTEQKLTAALKGKIDSYDAWKTAMRAVNTEFAEYPIHNFLDVCYPDSYPRVMEFNNTVYGSAKRIEPHTWWWHREQARMAMRVYPERTSVMEAVVSGFVLSAYCIHPSPDPQTPEAVTYTPDAAMGMADRQVKVSSLGKLLRKLCPLLSDAHVQQLEAAHRAELDPNFCIALTAAEIESVYRNMDGDSGCMRYGPERWDLPSHLHPSHVYAAPGFGVAYTKVDGVIKSRAVIFERPDGRKHWLRIYGDNALRRKLERAGYTPSSLADTAIAAVSTGKPDTYVVPYIDGVEGRQADYDGTWGYIDQAKPGLIQLVRSSDVSTMRNAGISLQQFKGHTSVTYNLQPQDLSDLVTTCPITGLEIDRRRSSFQRIYHLGKIQYAADCAEVRERRFPFAARFVVGNSSATVIARCPLHTPSFYHDGHFWFDGEAERRTCGYTKLDAARYSDDAWYKHDEVYVLEDGTIVLLKDMMRVVEADDSLRYVCQFDVKQSELRRQGYVSTPPLAHIKTLAHPDNRYLVQLASGKHALTNRHDVVKLHDGRWAPTSQTTNQTLFGRTAYFLKGETMPDTLSDSYVLSTINLEDGPDSLVRPYARHLLPGNNNASTVVSSIQSRLEERICRALRNGTGRTPYLVRTSDGGKLLRSTGSYYYDSVNSVREMAQAVEAETAIEETQGIPNAAHLRRWAAAAKKMLAAYDSIPTLVDQLQAELAAQATQQTEVFAEAA